MLRRRKTRSMALKIQYLVRKVILNATRKVFLRAASFLPQTVVQRSLCLLLSF